MDKKVVTASITLSVIAILSVFFIRPSGNGSATIEDSLVKIQKTKTINVCYGIYPTSVIYDSQTKQLSGYDIETIQTIFSQINVKPVFIEQAWGNMVTALQSGRCDISSSLIAQISRAATISFSDPLYYLGEGVLAKKGETRFTSVADLNNENVTIAVANGESGHNYAKTNLQKAKLSIIDIEGSDLSRIFTEVAAGRADVAMTDSGTVEKYVSTHPETMDLFQNIPIGLAPVGIAVRQTDKDLLQFLNASIKALKADGTIKTLQEKYHAGVLNEVNAYKVIQ